MLIKLIEKQSEQIDKRFEMMQENMNQRFEDLYRLISILYAISFAFLGYIWTEIRRKERKKYDIAYLEQQIYRAKPEIKAKIYFHLKEEAENIDKELLNKSSNFFSGNFLFLYLFFFFFNFKRHNSNNKNIPPKT